MLRRPLFWWHLWRSIFFVANYLSPKSPINIILSGNFLKKYLTHKFSAVIYPRNIDIGTCTLPSAIKSQKSKETRFFEANRLQCAHTNLKLNENPHAYLRKHADSAHKHENNLLCVPDQYENHQFFLNNIQQELPMKLKSCTCR